MNTHGALTLLIGAYLHEDFEEESGTVDGAVDSFCDRNRGRREQLVRDIDSLLTSTSSEAETEHALSLLGIAYQPPEGPDPYRRWLAGVAQIVRTSVINDP